jgi:hypothetical protein
VLSFGIYLPLWLGFSWSELRREKGDESMLPLAHALSLFVPGYGYWQVYRHFVTIGEALARAGSAMRVDPLSAAIGVVVWSLTFLHYGREPMFILFDTIELLAATAVVVYGQRALNEYFRVRPGSPVEEGIRDTDWLALAVAGGYFVITLLGYAVTTTN